MVMETLSKSWWSGSFHVSKFHLETCASPYLPAEEPDISPGQAGDQVLPLKHLLLVLKVGEVARGAAHQLKPWEELVLPEKVQVPIQVGEVVAWALSSGPPGGDKLQQPVGPDLLDATVRDGAHIGEVELLVPVLSTYLMGAYSVP